MLHAADFGSTSGVEAARWSLSTRNAAAAWLLNLCMFTTIIIWRAFDKSAFLADRTNVRAYATVLRQSVDVVCDVMYCG